MNVLNVEKTHCWSGYKWGEQAPCIIWTINPFIEASEKEWQCVGGASVVVGVRHGRERAASLALARCRRGVEGKTAGCPQFAALLCSARDAIPLSLSCRRATLSFSLRVVRSGMLRVCLRGYTLSELLYTSDSLLTLNKLLALNIAINIILFIHTQIKRLIHIKTLISF